MPVEGNSFLMRILSAEEFEVDQLLLSLHFPDPSLVPTNQIFLLSSLAFLSIGWDYS